jgi:ABC-type hemin transport system ATPase subunit
MTAQILAAELGNLISDSKRKNTELRTAAEKALQDLKSLSNTSEAQLSAGKHFRVKRSRFDANMAKRSLETTKFLLSVLHRLWHA